MSGFGLPLNRFTPFVENLEVALNVDIDGDNYIGPTKIPGARVTRRSQAHTRAPATAEGASTNVASASSSQANGGAASADPGFHAAIVVPMPPRKELQGRNVRCLFIGISYAGTPEVQLNGCHNDVALMQELLLTKLRLPVTETRVLVDDVNFRGGFDALPTRQNIVDALRWLVSDSKSGDAYFLHFSGHGTRVRDSSGDESDGFDEALVPADYKTAGVIIDDEIYGILFDAESGIKSGAKLTILTDCCNSGTLVDLPYTFVASPAHLADLTVNDGSEGKSGTLIGSLARRFLKRHVQSECDRLPEVQMISGCKDDQESADVHDTSSFETLSEAQRGSGGACTNALVEVIAQQRTRVSYGQLITSMQANLAARGFAQVPQWSSSKPLDPRAPFGFFAAA